MNAEMPSIFEEKYPIARKNYRCCECHTAIHVGEKYHYAKGCWDGKWAKYRTCIPCNILRHKLDCYDGMPPFGYLDDWAKEEGINIFIS